MPLSSLLHIQNPSWVKKPVISLQLVSYCLFGQTNFKLWKVWNMFSFCLSVFRTSVWNKWSICINPSQQFSWIRTPRVQNSCYVYDWTTQSCTQSFLLNTFFLWYMTLRLQGTSILSFQIPASSTAACSSGMAAASNATNYSFLLIFAFPSHFLIGILIIC